MTFYDSIRRQNTGAVPLQNYPVQLGYDLGLSQYIEKRMRLKDQLLQQQIEAQQRPKTTVLGGSMDASIPNVKARASIEAPPTENAWAGGGGTSVISPHPLKNAGENSYSSLSPYAPMSPLLPTQPSSFLGPLSQPEETPTPSYTDYVGGWDAGGNYLRGGKVNSGIWQTVNDVAGDIPSGGAIPGRINPNTGDDVQIKAKKGEYIIPLSVVRALGTKYFDNLVKKYGGDEERAEGEDMPADTSIVEASGRGQSAIPESLDMQSNLKGFVGGGPVDYSQMSVGQVLAQPFRGVGGRVVAALTPDVNPYSLETINPPLIQRPVQPPVGGIPTPTPVVTPQLPPPGVQQPTVPQMRQEKPNDMYPGYRISWDSQGIPLITNQGGSQGIAMDDYNSKGGIKQKGLPTLSAAISNEAADNANQAYAIEDRARRAEARTLENQSNLLERQQGILKSFYDSKDPNERAVLAQMYNHATSALSSAGTYSALPVDAELSAYHAAQAAAERRKTSASPANFDQTKELAQQQHPPKPESGDKYSDTYKGKVELVRSGLASEEDVNVMREIERLRGLGQQANVRTKPTYQQFKEAGIRNGRIGTEAEITSAYKRQYGE